MSLLHEQVEFLTKELKLTLNIQAVKMIEKEEEIPASAIRAGEKYGHMAYCQAQALAKRSGKTIYMEKKDHWCWASLVGFGHVDCSPTSPAFPEIAQNLGIADLSKAEAFFEHMPKLPYEKYIGCVVGPAIDCDFEPDIILINSNDNTQVRHLCWAIKNVTGKCINADMDAIDSCIYTIVKPMLDGEFSLAFPDMGESERALCSGSEMILGLPAGRIGELVEGLKGLKDLHVGYHDLAPEMMYDYTRPPFYNRLFEIWGLEKGKDWDR